MRKKGEESLEADGRQPGKRHAGLAGQLKRNSEMVQQTHCGGEKGKLGGGRGWGVTQLAAAAPVP